MYRHVQLEKKKKKKVSASTCSYFRVSPSWHRQQTAKFRVHSVHAHALMTTISALGSTVCF